MKYMFMGFAIGGILALGLETCHGADWSTEQVVEESVFQALIVADTLQTSTLHHRKHDGGQYEFRESDSQWAIGREPSAAAAVIYLEGSGIVHAFVTHELIKHDVPASLVRIWELVTIVPEGRCVYLNAHYGVKL